MSISRANLDDALADVKAALDQATASLALAADPASVVEVADPAPAPSAPDGYHLVKSGDTLYALSQTYSVSVANLKTWNGLTSDTIIVGQTLRVVVPVPPPTTTTTTPPAATLPSTHPAYGKSEAFRDDFATLEVGAGKRWNIWTPSYQYGVHNEGWYKRDWTATSAMQPGAGGLTITCTPKVKADGTPDTYKDPRDGKYYQYWNSGLLTTDASWNGATNGGNDFKVRAGDFLVCAYVLPSGNTGAFPALWTWDNLGGRNGEIDVFEYHSDKPDTLEMNNQLGQKFYDHVDPALIGAGKKVWIGTKLGATNCEWWLGATFDSMQKVHEDGYGIGTATPRIILNCSVSQMPAWHTPPVGIAPITSRFETVRVYR